MHGTTATDNAPPLEPTPKAEAEAETPAAEQENGDDSPCIREL